MELVSGQPSLFTATVAIVNAGNRPAVVGDGVDITAWKQAGFQFARLLVFLEGDGTDRSLTQPTGGTGGVELWTWRADKAGVFKWWLIAFLNNGVACPVPAAGGKVEGFQMISLGDRLFVAATLAAGAVTYSFMPVEFIQQLMPNQ